jgi:hypothetical protein
VGNPPLLDSPRIRSVSAKSWLAASMEGCKTWASDMRLKRRIKRLQPSTAPGTVTLNTP